MAAYSKQESLQTTDCARAYIHVKFAKLIPTPSLSLWRQNRGLANLGEVLQAPGNDAEISTEVYHRLVEQEGMEKEHTSYSWARLHWKKRILQRYQGIIFVRFDKRIGFPKQFYIQRLSTQTNNRLGRMLHTRS